MSTPDNIEPVEPAEDDLPETLDISGVEPDPVALAQSADRLSNGPSGVNL